MLMEINKTGPDKKKMGMREEAEKKIINIRKKKEMRSR